MSGQSKDKIYKIGQAAKIVGLKSYVLRFWEGEFEQLEPIRTPSGQRLYDDGHISLIRRIKTLLHDEGLTIEGARKRLDSPDAVEPAPETVKGGDDALSGLPLFSHSETYGVSVDRGILEDIHYELLQIKKILD